MSLIRNFKTLNMPNKLTLARIACIPVFMLGLLSDTVWGAYLALLVFIGAALTDYWDGKLAREHNLITNFGSIMDPLADKLLMATAFISFVQMAYATAWMVILIIGREFAITGMRVLAAAQGKIIAASTSGKHKTVSQIVAILIILVVHTFVHTAEIWIDPWEQLFDSWGRMGSMVVFILQQAPFWSMFVVAVLSVYSGLEYLVKNKDLFKEEKS